MKKLATVLATLCATCAALGLAACGGGLEPTVTYSLDKTKFDTTVVYGTEVGYDDLTVVGSDGTSIPVTVDMVSGVDVDSVGKKMLTVSYAQTEMKVEYTVYYEVTFMADGAVIGEPQYVFAADEIHIPDDYLDAEWDPAIPTTLTDNMTFTKKAETLENVSIAFANTATADAFVGASFPLSVNLTGTSEWSYAFDEAGVVSVERKTGTTLALTANKVGVATITVSATGANGTVSASKKIVVKPLSGQFSVAESHKTYGDENVLTLGAKDVRGVASTYSLSVFAPQGVSENISDYLVWESDNSTAHIDDQGIITLGAGEGVSTVSFKAKLVVDGEEYGVSAPFAVRCVWDGVTVNSYEDLYAATKLDVKKPIVLQGNIDFPTNVNDIHYDLVNSTYDTTFYKNINQESNAKIKTLLQFRSNVYGNGYTINAHNATLGLLDKTTGMPTDATLFRGPLNFVALTESNSSAVSVKGQDNVCFAVYENVTLNNVKLCGGNLTEVNGSYDLTQLNFAGTTVEVFGDNVNIEYSRISNGRTVLRVFGDETDATKDIHVNVSNSVLSGAREFILRMGSNCFVDGTDSNHAPYIDGERNLIADKKNYNSMTAAEKAAYDEKYIKTFVTVTDSQFKDAGIFAIGIDAHFAGLALHDGTQYGGILGASKDLWKNLAKTSYGAKLTFAGNVKLYNWKPLDQIDSSTLIEIVGDSQWKDTLDFNVGEMVRLAAQQDGYETVITTYNNTAYVHAGIAFFGGGRNYGVFEDGTNVQNGVAQTLGLNGFEVSLNLVEKSFLTAAAGPENFYFNVYAAGNKNGETLFKEQFGIK